jgi:D-glycero-beta-D-manno-heptose-7-phosphate kinase
MFEQLSKTLNRFSGQKILVIGDLIADEFLYGRIARVSREAPVLVLEYQNLVRLPGGAANAANNLLALGCTVAISGAIGDDEPGKNLVRMLAEKGANVRAVHKARFYATPIKTRILAGAHHSAPQQVVRVDRIPAAGILPPLSSKQMQNLFSSADGIIVSDYGYGSVTATLVDDVCRAAGKRGVPVVVDSRFRMTEFQNVTSITPNITELEASTGVAIGSDAKLLQKIAMRQLRKQHLRSLLVTQGRFGMTLFEARKPPLHIPIYGTDEVADVTGAGDTVIAVFTLALACGSEPAMAARLANYAGGIVVMKRGTSTVTCEELRTAVEKDLLKSVAGAPDSTH